MIQGNLPPLLKNQTCAVTGHRVLSEDFNFEQLKNDLLKIYDSGFSVFLVGMAQGFDIMCYKALSQLKNDYRDIKICAVIPCADQSKYFSAEEKYDYYEAIEEVDYIVKEERTYFKGCMLIRNDYLVKNSSLLYAYYSGVKTGGTYYTVKKATEEKLIIKYYGKE